MQTHRLPWRSGPAPVPDPPPPRPPQPGRKGAPARTGDGRTCPTPTPLPTCTSSRARTAVHWTHPPRILSEHLAPLPEPLACLLTPGAVGPAPAVAAVGARALLDLTPLALEGKKPWPAWLAPHPSPPPQRALRLPRRHRGGPLPGENGRTSGR